MLTCAINGKNHDVKMCVVHHIIEGGSTEMGVSPSSSPHDNRYGTIPLAFRKLSSERAISVDYC